MSTVCDVSDISHVVAQSLAEDIASGDVSAQLIAKGMQAEAHVETREAAVICGRPWAAAVFLAVDERIHLEWRCEEGDRVRPGQSLLTITGPLRSIVTAERTALNWLQTLSGTATTVAHYVSLLEGLPVKLLDTRKTLPGLRRAQKYAVMCGGGHNHRMGLYDAFLIKENHIAGAGSITAALQRAKKAHPSLLLEVEVETLAELAEALQSAVDVVMLDNFSTNMIEDAVVLRQQLARQTVQFEVSGTVTAERIRELAELGVDAISVGALTKNVQAIDLSLQVDKAW